MNKKKIKFLVFALIPILLLGYLAFKGLEGSAAYYYTIKEAAALESNMQKLRIKGSLIKDSIEYNPEIPLLTFTLSDEEEQLTVYYQGVLPDNFYHADEVIVEGRFNEQWDFAVSKLMLQCPSKYEADE